MGVSASNQRKSMLGIYWKQRQSGWEHPEKQAKKKITVLNTQPNMANGNTIKRHLLSVIEKMEKRKGQCTGIHMSENTYRKARNDQWSNTARLLHLLRNESKIFSSEGSSCGDGFLPRRQK